MVTNTNFPRIEPAERKYSPGAFLLSVLLEKEGTLSFPESVNLLETVFAINTREAKGVIAELVEGGHIEDVRIKSVVKVTPQARSNLTALLAGNQRVVADLSFASKHPIVLALNLRGLEKEKSGPARITTGPGTG